MLAEVLMLFASHLVEVADEKIADRIDLDHFPVVWAAYCLHTIQVVGYRSALQKANSKCNQSA